MDITAETRRTVAKRDAGLSSIHERLESYLLQHPRRGSHRWILYNDGSGEIADYLVIEELPTGEVHLGLWHAKASKGDSPSLRVKDLQEVVAQAIRSRRWFTSTTLWNELAGRLDGKSSPRAELVAGSDDPESLRCRLGLDAANDAEFVAWSRRYPVVRGLLGIVQPGVGSDLLRRALAEIAIPPAAQSIRELLTVLADTAVADGAEVQVVAAP